MDHPKPYDILGWTRGESDQVTKQCTFKFLITKTIIDESVCDVLLMDCTIILIVITFIHDKKARLIPYQGKGQLFKGEKTLFITYIHVFKSSILVNGYQAKWLIQASYKFFLFLLIKFFLVLFRICYTWCNARTKIKSHFKRVHICIWAS